jgi:hypothetical protein
MNYAEIRRMNKITNETKNKIVKLKKKYQNQYRSYFVGVDYDSSI